MHDFDCNISPLIIETWDRDRNVARWGTLRNSTELHGETIQENPAG